MPVDPDEGPLQSFAHDLQLLRRQAGEPTYRSMARSAGISPTALSRAAKGRQLPTLQTALAFIRACGAGPDVEQVWRQRWEEVRVDLARMQRTANDSTGPEDTQETRDVDAAVTAPVPISPVPHSRRPHLSLVSTGSAAGIAALGIALVGVAVAGIMLGGAHGRSSPRPAGSPGQAVQAAIDTDGHGRIQPVRRVGVVSIDLGHVIDLDSTASDWGMLRAPQNNPSDLEFTLEDHTLTGVENAVLAVLPRATPATLGECSTQQAYGVEMRPSQIGVGAAFCIITDQRRYALLRITKVVVGSDDSIERVTLAIRVWQPRTAS